jgi:predicted protein tyrosine phosphatase
MIPEQKPMNKFLNITIASLDDVEMLAGTPFTKIISINDAHLEKEGGYERRIKAYFPTARAVFSYFDDVDHLTEDGPQENEIGLLLDFSQRFTMADKILIHCRAGVSRSTALAYAVVCQHGQPGQEAEAFAYVRQIRPQLFPNGLVVKMADRILKSKGRLLAAAKAHRWETPL